MDGMARQSSFLMDLYRGASQQSAETFQDWALERLAQDLPFDSAVWASGVGTAAGPVFHSIHLLRQPTQMLIDYESLKHLDNFFAEGVANAGRSLRASSRTSLPEAFIPYIDRYGLEQALCTIGIDPDTALLTGFSLYRADRANPFTEAEARFKECVFPHLIEADSRNKLAHLEIGAQPRTVRQWRSAAVDAKALLRCIDDGFKQLLLSEWPEWHGPYLPDPLRNLMSSGTHSGAVGRRSIVRFATFGDLTLVQLRERAAIDDLPERVRQVAHLAAKGQSHKAIASTLEVSPATVRNQLATAYQRLGVNNRAEMAALVLRVD
jgi:DNA-binding CsgD family transcriptional regulator